MSAGKQKSRGGVKKRFRLTATGKIKRRKCNHRHILTKKSGKRKRQLLGSAYVHKADEERIRKMIVE